MNLAFTIHTFEKKVSSIIVKLLNMFTLTSICLYEEVFYWGYTMRAIHEESRRQT